MVARSRDEEAADDQRFALTRPAIPWNAGSDVRENATVASLVDRINRNGKALNDDVIQCAEILAKRGQWTACIRLIVKVGGYQPAEISAATGVMRSTVSRWYNGETVPSPSQAIVYVRRLSQHMMATRNFDLQVDPDDLIA